jgi:hypothetical protein
MIRRSLFVLSIILFGTLLFGMTTSRSAYAIVCPDGSVLPDERADECPPATGADAREVASCDSGSFLGFPKWYKYIQGTISQSPVTGLPQCQPIINGLNDIWKIVAAVVEMLLRVAALLAIGFVVYGGVTYTISQGQPDKTKQALQTIISAIVGLAISVVATAFVTFVAGRF